MVEIGGDVGSIQLFIKGEGIEITEPIFREEIFSKNIQAMLIFDLLFANCDRHEGNYLVRRLQQGIHKLYAIDHDACLEVGSGRLLKLEYLQYLSGFAFHEDLKPLFSSEAIETYRQIINHLGLTHQDELYRWMDTVVDILKNPHEQSLRKLAEVAMVNYEQHFQL